MKLTIDLESRATIDLKKCGMYKYAEHEETEILCFAIKEDAELPYLWIPEKFKHLHPTPDLSITDDYFTELILYADEIESHNCGFERTMWHHIMHKRYGFPDLPLDIMRCSAALAASYALPRSLKGATSALGLEQQKDQTGYKIMMKMCKPNRKGEWNEDPNDFKLLCDYCVQDVEAEHALSEALYALPDSEQRLWILDQKINDAGIEVDIDAIKNLKNKIAWKERRLLLELQKLTKGKVKSPRQVKATIEYINENTEYHFEDLQKQTVKSALDNAECNITRRILEIRKSLSKSSTAKLDAMLNMACEDNRVRGTTLYHGASTGRWAGKGIQVHNLPRESFDDEIEWILRVGVDEVEKKYGCMFATASKCVRGMIIAKDKHILDVSDFNSIEARVLAWLANEEKALNAFHEGLDIYKVEAGKVYNIDYEDVTKDQRRIGKVCVLALGYQGWIGAFQSMAPVYGVKIPDEQAADIARAWRENNPKIVMFWRGVEDAAIKAIETKDPYSFGRIKFGMRKDFLHIRLPSGRLLSYYNPYTRDIKDKFGREKTAIYFKGVESNTKKWCEQQTYGGKITENIVQAIARDILAEALLRLDDNGYKIIMHVHDEIISEDDVFDQGKDIKEFERIMSEVPEWARGLPIGVEGYSAKRYRKG